ncbi:hypothetical protein F4781DRAFT_100073 [Annulohypoxylon bovei var. microspora]|nr:hypothetical protein F4781DRAFT_100073 [Annulohypoxylon bovei var. microspora]
MASLDHWELSAASTFSSPSGSDDTYYSNPSPVVNPSVIGSTSAMSYLGNGHPHVIHKVGESSRSLDVNWRPQVYPRSDHATLPGIDQDRSIDGPCRRDPGELIIVPYKGPKAKAKRKPTCHRAYRVDALVNDKNPKSEFKRDKNGLFQGSFRTFGASERIRSDLNVGSRSNTAITREYGACGRCQQQKLRCNMSRDPFVPCERCSKVSHRFLKTPCIRVRLRSLHLHRRGSTLNNHLESWTAVQDRLLKRCPVQSGDEGSRPLAVLITQDQGIEIPVTIRRFAPRSADTISWKWRDKTSRERVMEMPPFYISNVEEATWNMRNAVSSMKEEYINCLLGVANPIIRKTFEAAFRYLEVSGSSLVLNCLMYWVATRFIEKPWRICSSLPGFEPPYDPYDPYDPDEMRCPFSGIVPVTPVMDTQIDDIAIRSILGPLEKRILNELNQKIHEKKRQNWFDIYLATFILMNNFEFVFTDVVDYTGRHGLKPSSTGARSLSKGYFHACKTMLVYFRFACNGHAPLALSWQEPITPIDGLTFDQQEYLKDIKKDVDRQRKSLEGWRDGSVYSTPLYLCYQVLAEDWSPTVENAEPLDNFTEEDFLTS